MQIQCILNKRKNPIFDRCLIIFICANFLHIHFPSSINCSLIRFVALETQSQTEAEILLFIILSLSN